MVVVKGGWGGGGGGGGGEVMNKYIKVKKRSVVQLIDNNLSTIICH